MALSRVDDQPSHDALGTSRNPKSNTALTAKVSSRLNWCSNHPLRWKRTVQTCGVAIFWAQSAASDPEHAVSMPTFLGATIFLRNRRSRIGALCLRGIQSERVHLLWPFDVRHRDRTSAVICPVNKHSSLAVFTGQFQPMILT